MRNDPHVHFPKRGNTVEGFHDLSGQFTHLIDEPVDFHSSRAAAGGHGRQGLPDENAVLRNLAAQCRKPVVQGIFQVIRILYAPEIEQRAGRLQGGKHILFKKRDHDIVDVCKVPVEAAL